jgi:hypothetical protein
MRRHGWNQSATEHDTPDPHVDQLLTRTSSADREVIARMPEDELIGGVVTALERLHAFQIPLFENGYEGILFHAFVGRRRDDKRPWPEGPRD